jgi:DNA-binding NarL/FixJ family response regulator
MLFEIYQRFGSVTAEARRLLKALAPPILGAIGLILIVQIPLFWSLTRRLQRSHEQREGLLANAVTSSRRERRRVASYLHDGPVQELAGLAFSLAPVADGAESRGADADAAVARNVIDRLRSTVRDLRALLVDVHPPILASAGLDAAIRDLVSPLAARGTTVELRVAGDDRLDPEMQALVYRVAQEALRNVIAYADATTVSVEVDVVDSTASLLVADDGRGFAPDVRDRRRTEGHLGLSLVEELARRPEEASRSTRARASSSSHRSPTYAGSRRRSASARPAISSAEDVVRGIRAAASGGAPLNPHAARLLLEAKNTPDPLEGISPREREVFALLLDGLPNKLIAQRLGISEKTVKTHLTNIFRRIDVTDRVQAVLWAERQGLRHDLSQ